MAGLRFRRVLLKLSGEALMQAGNHIDPDFLHDLSTELRAVHQSGVQLALVIGGGNIFRGLAGSARGMDRSRADHMGMLATVINALALCSSLESLGVPTRVQSAIRMPQVAEPFVRERAVKHLEKGRVVIFAAGTGNPFFTTDTAASLRAAEIGADCLMKATKVDGVYDADPVVNPNARRYDRLTYADVLAQNLGVMDLAAITLCRDNHIPILVFSILERGVMTAVVRGEGKGTLIGENHG